MTIPIKLGLAVASLSVTSVIGLGFQNLLSASTESKTKPGKSPRKNRKRCKNKQNKPECKREENQ